MFKKLNEKYDNLEEPKRFLVFLALIMPALLLTMIQGFEVVGLVWLGLVAIPRILGK